MKLYVLLILAVGAFGFSTAEADVSVQHDKVVACYVASWAYYRNGPGKFAPGHVNPDLCTHVIYTFAGLDAATWTIRSLDPWGDIEIGGVGNYRRMTALREQNPRLKVSLAIGGWSEGSEKYSELASSPRRRKTFINSVLDFLKKYEFDGLDLDWVYPGLRGGASYDKRNFVLLVKELREAFKNESYLLTTAIGATREVIDTAYDIPKLSKYLDYIYVMTYDYHGAWEGKVLPNSPLRETNGTSVADSIEYLLSIGAPANKLVLGLPFYGRIYNLTNTLELSPSKSDIPLEFDPIGKPASGSNIKGPYTKQNGFAGYNEICEEMGNNPDMWKTGWHNESSTPYAMMGNVVVVYEDPRSIKEKVKFAVQSKIAGVMVWTIDTDDFQGECGAMNEDILNSTEIDFPLLRTIHLTVIADSPGNAVNQTDIFY